MDEIREIEEKVKDSIIQSYPKKLEIIQAKNYYLGRQWDVGVFHELQLRGKPALTFNYLARLVNFALGVFSDIKFTDKFLPKSPEFVDLAEVAGEVVRYIYDQNNMDFVFTKIFKDIILAGEAYAKVWVDTLEDPNGKIVITRLKPTLVFYDPDSIASDWSDCEFVVEVLYVKKETLKAMFPEVADEIESASERTTFLFGYPLPFLYQNVQSLDYETKHLALSPAAKISPGKVEVVRFQQKVLENKFFIYDTVDKFYYEVPGNYTKKEVEGIISRLNETNSERFTLKKETVKRIRLTTFLPDTDLVLEDIIDPYGFYGFDIVPFFGYRDEEETFGFYRLVKDAQDEINKRKSLTLEILKDAPKNKFFIPKTAFIDENERIEMEAAFEDDETHFLPINVVQGFPQPAVTDAAQKIAAVMQMELRSELQLKDLAGLTDAVMGIIPRKIQSGHAIARLQEAGLQFLKYFIESYKNSRKILSLTVFEIAKKILPNNTVIRIAHPITGEIDFRRINVELGEFNLLKLIDAKFDVKIEMSDYQPTLRMEYLAKLVRLAELGYPIPPELILEYFDIPSAIKTKVYQSLQTMMEAKAKENQEKEE